MAQKQKVSDDLIKRFTDIEQKLLDILNMPSVDIEEKVTRATLKKNLSKYIKNVEEAKVLFEEYEMIALEIEKLSGRKVEGEAISKAVVELREDEPVSNLEQYVDELSIQGDMVKVVKKKKSSGSAKEL